jgi:glycosidase
VAKLLFFLPLFLLTCFASANNKEFSLWENPKEIIFSNSKVALHFSKESGFLNSIFYLPLKLQVLGYGKGTSSLDIRVEGEWLVEKRALKEAVKNKCISLEGIWKFSLDPEDKGEKEGWHLPSFDDRNWADFPAPAMWEDLGYTEVYPNSPSPDWKPYNGYAFLRKRITIPEDWKGRDLLLYVGAIDDFDWVYFNGELIGKTGEETPNWWEKPRIYSIPQRLVKWGEENIISIRIYDRGGEGGIRGPLFIIKKEDWESLGSPVKLLNYELKDEKNGKRLVIRSKVGDWVLESSYLLLPKSDIILRDGKIIYEGKEKPHISNLRFSLVGIRIGNKSDCWFMIPSNFPPTKYKFEKEGRVISDNIAWSSNRCVMMRNDKLKISFLALFYSETEGASCYLSEGKEGIDVIHTLSAADVMGKRRELAGGTQIIRIVQGDLGDALRKEQEVYDIIGLKPPQDRPEWARRAIIYSAYPGGTIDSGLRDVGGFDNFTNYLPHLADLGFNVLWLLPVYPGLYGPTDYYKIEDALGGVESAREFIQKAHSLGIKILFDLIPHGPREESGLLEKMPEAVSRDEKGNVLYWWGCLSCDYASEVWQRYMAEHAAYWVRELDIDGYRVDCAGGGPANWDPNSLHRPTLSGLWGGLQILAKARKEMRKYKKEVMLLPEATGPWFFRYSDVVYDFPFLSLCQNYSQYNREEFIRWLQEWLEFEKYAYPKGATLMRFVESHDTVRFAGMNGNGSFNAFLALCALIEGAPMVYHDGDVGRGPFLKHLYAIRRSCDELSIGDAHYLAVASDKKDIFTCLRTYKDKSAIVAINMSGRDEEVKLSVPKSLIGSSGKIYLYEAFEGKEVKGEIKGDKLIINLKIKAYSPAIVLVRNKKESLPIAKFSLPSFGRKGEMGKVPSMGEREGKINIENGIYEVVIDKKTGLLKHLSLKNGDNWLEKMDWEEGKRRMGMGKLFKASELKTNFKQEREGDELILKFDGETDWMNYGIQYRFNKSNRIDLRFSLIPKKDIGMVKGELWQWFKLRGIDHWMTNSFEGICYDDFFIRHPNEGKTGGRYWHTPFLYEASRCPLNPYAPFLCALRKDEYLLLLLPSFSNLPENAYIREKIEDLGFHFLLAMADGKRGWKISPDMKYELRCSLFLGKGKLPPLKEAQNLLPKIECDGADYIVETKDYRAEVTRRSGQLKSLVSRGQSLLQGGEIYSDKGIYGEFYDSLGNAFPLVGSSNNDPEAETRFLKTGNSLTLAVHSFLREANSGWNNFARPPVEYEAIYEFSNSIPYIKTSVQVRTFVEKETTAFLAQRLNFKGITSCIVNGKEIPLSQTGRVWESRNFKLNKVNLELKGKERKVEIRNVEIPNGSNLFIYNSGEGNIIVFFAFLDGEAKIQPRWQKFSYEIEVTGR